MRQERLLAKKSICIERARLLTEFFRKEGFDTLQPILRQARALNYIFEHLPTVIFEKELIVGSTTRHYLGTMIFPEFMSLSILPELPTISKRKFDPVEISEEDTDTLANEIFPFWKDLNVHEYVRREGNNPYSLNILERLVFFMLAKSYGITHIIPDYPTLLHLGLKNLIKEASQRENDTKDLKKIEFYRAVQIVLRGVIRFAERYAMACESKARMSDSKRAEELYNIANILRRVPAEPANSLHEALQSIWITQVALHQENTNMALSFGRLDQYLYPYFKKDMAEGRLDEKSAGELIGCFFLKMGDHTILVPESAQDFFGGASTNQAVTIGGVKPNGSDGVNELTYILLKMAKLLALREPNVCARLHRHSSQKYLDALIESISKTGAIPATYGDETIIKSLIRNGISPEDARDYGIVGCVELTSACRTMGLTGAIIINLASILELALNNGVHTISKLSICPNTGVFRNFSNFDDFYTAFLTQLESMVSYAVDANNRFAEAHKQLHQTPLLSSLIQGTMDSGKDVTNGGAKYNSSGVAIVGLADVADSLTVTKSLVFEQRKISQDELKSALLADFIGYEKIYALITNKAPKYGNDDPIADMMTVKLVDDINSIFSKHKNPRGGRYHVGYWSVTKHAGFGLYTGALPNGKRRGAPLASGATPVSGVARKGPTASFASTAKLPAECMANGIANNHKLQKELLNEPGKMKLFAKLVDVYFKKGGMQIQFTVQDRKTLLNAQKNPQAYRDLLVRVSGYSAYFVDLNRRMQDEIINRTEDQI